MSTVLTVGPNKGLKIYSSIRAASRALSGKGTDTLRRTITRRMETGGGYVGKVWVEKSNFPGSTSVSR